MAVQKSKVTRSRRGQRRSHDALKSKTLSVDPVSGEKHIRHQMTKDGFYKGRLVKDLREPRSEKNNKDYSNPDNDPRGPWTSVSFVSQRTKSERANLAYSIINPFTGKEYEHPTNSWKYNKSKYDEMLSDNRFYWGKNNDQDFPRIKRFLIELREAFKA